MDSKGKFIAYTSSDEITPAAQQAQTNDVQVWGEDWPFNRLRLVDVMTKESRVLFHRDAHVYDFAWHSSGDKIILASTMTPDSESCDADGTWLDIMEVNSGKSTRLAYFPGQVERLLWHGDDVYFVGPAGEQIYTSGWTIFKAGAEAKNPEANYERLAYGINECPLDCKDLEECILVHVLEGMYDQIRVLGGPTLFADKRKILAWDARLHAGVVTLVIAQGSVNQPPEVFALQLPLEKTRNTEQERVQLSQLGSSLSVKNLGSCTYISTPSLDGQVTLECPFLRRTDSSEAQPARGPARPSPAIVLIHGGPYGHYNEAFDAFDMMWTPFLLARGYSVLLADYRGSSGRGDAWARAARSMGKQDYDDVIALTDRAVKMGYADPDRLVVGGYSNGGYLAHLCGVRNGTHGLGWKFKAVISGAGCVDQDSIAMSSDMGIWKAEHSAAGGPPWALSKDDTRSRQASAIWEFGDAVRSKVPIPPLLMIHGEHDARVPLEQARGMRRAMQWAGLEFQLAVYPREGHTFTERKHLVDAAERVVSWCDRRIGVKR